MWRRHPRWPCKSSPRGYNVNTYTYNHNHNKIRKLAAYRLQHLHRLYPQQFPTSAFRSWMTCLPQDVNNIALGQFDNLPPVDIVFATPPCTSFSPTSNINGWDSPHSIAFVSCVNLIHDLYHKQPDHLVYVAKNVPNASKFLAVRQALGDDLNVNRHTARQQRIKTHTCGPTERIMEPCKNSTIKKKHTHWAYTPTVVGQARPYILGTGQCHPALPAQVDGPSW